MPLIFDVPQQTQIEALFLQGEATPATPGAFSPMYDYINNVLITGSPPPTVDPEVKKSQLWFSGATQANSGLGPYAIVIREYTQNQQRLHLGRPAPGGLGPGGLQAASNEVATRVFNDTKFGNPAVARLPWTLLKVSEIAENDASAVGLFLFNISGSSAASPQNAAWAGTVLHPLLGDDQSWRLISAPLASNSGLPAETVADTFDDWRNLLFAQASYYRALRSSFADAGYDLVAAPQLGALFADVGTALEACFISERFWSTGCSPSLDVAMRGRRHTAHSSVAQATRAAASWPSSRSRHARHRGRRSQDARRGDFPAGADGADLKGPTPPGVRHHRRWTHHVRPAAENG